MAAIVISAGMRAVPAPRMFIGASRKAQPGNDQQTGHGGSED
jgi:hypothetical protein